jgi:hypothetical protein
MKLTDPTGISFALTISGYQFPALEAAPFDSNWLDIRVDVTTDQGTWSATDPCLLTYEVKQLADWLDAIAVDRLVDSNCAFTEPCLLFQLVGDETGERTLRIYFELELRPSWAPSKYASQEDLWVEFPLTAIDISSATKSLRTQLQRYPQRAEV